MGQLGFIINKEDKIQKIIPKKGISFLEFDSGERMTFEDANVHTLIFGTTGCGKTSGPVLYSLNSCIMQGFGGLVIDIKNNFTEKVKELARLAGRESHVIELGSNNTAMPINLLSGMTRSEIYDYFKMLMEKNVVSAQDHNKGWNIKGLNIATDIAHILSLFSGIDEKFAPTVLNVAHCVNNPAMAAELFTLFVQHKEVFEDADEINDLIQSITSNNFHICNTKDRKTETYHEQVTWGLYAIRNALQVFLQTPGLVRNFTHGNSFSMEKALKEKKIIVLRFDCTCGVMGESIARHLTSEYYKAVYKIGLSMKKDEYSFVFLDEFQQFADLSNERFSDGSFVAQAREFKSIFVASTQSMSALLSSRHKEYAVQQFVANCNNKIIFYSEDPLLKKMVHNYTEVNPVDLKKETFVVKYNAATREHIHSIESLQNAHDYMQRRLKNTASKAKYPDKQYKQPSFTKLLKDLKYALEHVPESDQSNPQRKMNKKLQDIISF